MNTNHPDQSSKTAHSKVDNPNSDKAAVQAELVTEELLDTEDLSHIVGGLHQEPRPLDNPGVLPPYDSDDDPFEPSPTYPPVPTTGMPPSHSPQE